MFASFLAFFYILLNTYKTAGRTAGLKELAVFLLISSDESCNDKGNYDNADISDDAEQIEITGLMQIIQHRKNNCQKNKGSYYQNKYDR